jgi:hypothetical protein
MMGMNAFREGTFMPSAAVADRVAPGAVLADLARGFLAKNRHAGEVAERLRTEAGVNWIDRIDTLVVPASGSARAGLIAAGFSGHALSHPPTGVGHAEVFEASGSGVHVVLGDSPTSQCWLRVDSAADFLSAWTLEHPIEGEPCGPFRRGLAYHGTYADLYVVERRGSGAFAATTTDHHKIIASLRHADRLRTRHRDFGADAAATGRGLHHLEHLVDEAVREIGASWAGDLFRRAEIEFWSRRCLAGRSFAAGLERLGLGWGVPERIAYRTAHAAGTQRIFDKLGLSAGVEIDDSAAAKAWAASHGESLLRGGPGRVVVRGTAVQNTQADTGGDFEVVV